MILPGNRISIFFLILLPFTTPQLMRHSIFIFLFVTLFKAAYAQSNTYILRPAQVFDGAAMHSNWVVVVRGKTIVAAGHQESIDLPKEAITITLTGATLMPGMIEGHSHLLLHPYNETSWNDQVMKESDAYRVARATVHAHNTLMAGFTTVRDLGSEGAGYADVGLKKAIDDGVIPGPAIIAEKNATTVIEPGWEAELTALDHLVLDRRVPRTATFAAGTTAVVAAATGQGVLPAAALEHVGAEIGRAHV